MSQALIDELRRENLCTHFVLPLLKLNKFSFIQSNFVNCYLSPDGTSVYVKIIEPLFIAKWLLSHTMCKGFYTDSEDGLYLGYWVPRSFSNDVKLFMEGKFSMMSKGTKSRIIRYSGLANKERSARGVVTDGRLLALEKHSVLKRMWEHILSTSEDENRPGTGVIELAAEAELLSVPGKESYIDPRLLRPIRKVQL